MGWMLLLCLRCRLCWRMSSRGAGSLLGGRGCCVVVAPPLLPLSLCGVCCLLWSVMCCGGEVE